MNLGKRHFSFEVVMHLMKKAFRALSLTLACFTIVASPLAQAESQIHRREALMQSFLKRTQLAGKTTPTVGEFYAEFREMYPVQIRGYLDQWVMRNKNEPMPHVDFQQVKDGEDHLQYRLLVRTNDGKTLTVMTGDDFVKIGAVKLDSKTAKDPVAFVKNIAKDDPYLKKIFEKSEVAPTPKPVAPTFAEFKRLKPSQRALYFLQLRNALEDAQKIMAIAADSQKTTMNSLQGGLEVVARWMMGECAFGKVEDLPASNAKVKPKAKTASTSTGSQSVVRVGGNCIVAGYMSTYGENLSCGGVASGRADFTGQISKQFSAGGVFSKASSCSSGSFPCNPMVYGFNGTSPYCIPHGEIKTATRDCNKASPLAGADNPAQRAKDRQRIIQSWVTAQGDSTELKFDADGKIDPSQYDMMKKQIDGLNDFIGSAVAFCDSDQGQKLQKERKQDQDLACEAIKVRALDLAKFANQPPPPPVPPAPICSEVMPGSENEGKECVCREPKVEVSDNGKRLCKDRPQPPPPPPPIAEEPIDDPPERPAPPPKQEEECGWFCRNGTSLLIGGGLLVGIGLFAWWLTRDTTVKATTPQYVPPVPPPFPTTPTTPTTPPPVVVPPPANEGGTGTAPIQGGGVRGNR